jgi:hypothetical protein
VPCSPPTALTMPWQATWGCPALWAAWMPTPPDVHAGLHAPQAQSLARTAANTTHIVTGCAH